MHFTCQCILPTKCWVSMCCDLSFTVLCIYSCWIADTLYLKSCPNLVGNVRFIVASPLIPSLKKQTCIIRKQRMRAAQSEIDTAPCSNYDSTPVLLQTRLCRGRRRSGSRRWRSLCPSAGRCLIPPDPSSSTSCASRPRKMTSPTRRRPRPSRRSSGWVASWTWGGRVNGLIMLHHHDTDPHFHTTVEFLPRSPVDPGPTNWPLTVPVIQCVTKSSLWLRNRRGLKQLCIV